MKLLNTVLFIGLLCTASTPAEAQNELVKRGSDNVTVLGHLPLGPQLSVTDLDIEQELSRPYAYVGRAAVKDFGPKGMDIIDISNPSAPKLLLERFLGLQNGRLQRLVRRAVGDAEHFERTRLGLVQETVFLPNMVRLQGPHI